MSAQATGWVWSHSPLKGVALTVHLAIADSVNDQYGYEFWMSVPNLARKARCSRDAARKALRLLEGCGPDGQPIDGAPVLLEVVDERLGETTRYRFLMPDLPRVTEAAPPRATGGGTPRQKRGVPPATEAGDPASGKHLSQGGTQQGTEGDPVTARAQAIVRAVYDRKTPKPATPFVGALKIARALIDAGHADAAIEAAMLAAPTISTGSVEVQLAMASRSGRRAQVIPLRPEVDRAASSGKLDL